MRCFRLLETDAGAAEDYGVPMVTGLLVQAPVPVCDCGPAVRRTPRSARDRDEIAARTRVDRARARTRGLTACDGLLARRSGLAGAPRTRGRVARLSMPRLSRCASASTRYTSVGEPGGRCHPDVPRRGEGVRVSASATPSDSRGSSLIDDLYPRGPFSHKHWIDLLFMRVLPNLSTGRPRPVLLTSRRCGWAAQAEIVVMGMRAQENTRAALSMGASYDSRGPASRRATLARGAFAHSFWGSRW